MSDAYMYACHEEYMENVLRRNCTKFYKVRGMIFAEAFWIGLKSGRDEDRQKTKEIWNQRKKKWPLVWWAFCWGYETFKRKIKKKLRGVK